MTTCTAEVLDHATTMAMVAEATRTQPALVNTGGGCLAIHIPTPTGSALLTDWQDSYTPDPTFDVGWCLGFYGPDDEARYAEGTYVAYTAESRTAATLARLLLDARHHFTDRKDP